MRRITKRFHVPVEKASYATPLKNKVFPTRETSSEDFQYVKVDAKTYKLVKKVN